MTSSPACGRTPSAQPDPAASGQRLLGHVPPALADHSALFDLEMVHAYAALCWQPFT
jgi:hypothetical protein